MKATAHEKKRIEAMLRQIIRLLRYQSEQPGSSHAEKRKFYETIP